MALRRDVGHQKRLQLGVGAIVDRNGVVGSEVAPIVAAAGIVGGLHARGRAAIHRKALGARRRLTHACEIVQPVRRPAWRGEDIVVADRVGAIVQHAHRAARRLARRAAVGKGAARLSGDRRPRGFGVVERPDVPGQIERGDLFVAREGVADEAGDVVLALGRLHDVPAADQEGDGEVDP